MQISQIRDEVSEGLLTFAWRQWAQVGVSATVQGSDRWALDPEALILFTIGENKLKLYGGKLDMSTVPQ